MKKVCVCVGGGVDGCGCGCGYGCVKETESVCECVLGIDRGGIEI